MRRKEVDHHPGRQLFRSRANRDGGAIAHGHPIGATGAVLATRLMHSMRRDGLKRGVVTLCIGGGLQSSSGFYSEAKFLAKGRQLNRLLVLTKSCPQLAAMKRLVSDGLAQGTLRPTSHHRNK